MNEKTSPKTQRTGLAPVPGVNTSREVSNITGSTPANSADADMVVTRNGRLQRLHAKPTLKLSQKHIYTIDGGESFTIQGEGYNYLMKTMGVQLVFPPTLFVNDQEVNNPYVEKDPQTKKISNVWILGHLIGRDQLGNAVMHKEVFNFSPDDYFGLELLKLVGRKDRWQNGKKVKATDWSDNGRLISRAAYERMELEEWEAFYPIDDVFGALVDLRSTEVAEAMKTRQENHKYATRKAKTMVARRLCASHPAFPPQHIAGSDVVQTWRWKDKDGNWKTEICGKKPFGDYQKVVEATVQIPVLGWIGMGELQNELTGIAALVGAGKVVPPEMVTFRDLGEATISDELKDLEEPKSPMFDANVVTPEHQAQDDDSPPFDEDAIAKAQYAAQLAQQVRKQSGGDRRVSEICQVMNIPADTPWEELEPSTLDGLIESLEQYIPAEGAPESSAGEAQGETNG